MFAAPEGTPPAGEIGTEARRSGQKGSRVVVVLLWVLLIWSAGLRIWLASSGLHAGRYWDERYNVKNLHSILQTGSLEPVTYYYQSLSYLPQAALLGGVQGAFRVSGRKGFSWFVEGALRPSGYFLCRLVQVAYGVLSIYLLFLLGRRLGSPATGLWAGFFLSVAPIHIRMSIFFKPDVQLLALLLLALWWSLDAIEESRLGRYLLAGLGIGLAISSKLNGGVVALPLTLGALLRGRSDRRHWTGLPLAGVVSALVFLAFNPYLWRSLTALGRSQELYAQRGGEGSYLERLVAIGQEAFSLLLTPGFHGAGLGVAALAGLVLLLVRSVMRPARGENRTGRLGLALLLSFPLAYTLLYAAATAYPKTNNFFPLLPISALAAGSFLVFLSDAALRFLPIRRRRFIVGFVAAILVGVVSHRAQLWAYQTVIPTTWQAALDLVTSRLAPWEGRVALFEEVPSKPVGRPRPLRAMVQPLRVDEQPVSRLEHSDAEIFASRRLPTEDGLLEARIDRRLEAEVHSFHARLFRLRGPEVIVLLHPETEIGRSELPLIAAEAPNQWTVALPPAPAGGDLLSIELWTPRRGDPDASPRIGWGTEELALFNRRFGRQTVWLSERFERCDSEGSAFANIELPPELVRGESNVRVYRWRASCADAADS